MLELVEGRIVIFVDTDEFLLKPFKFVFILWIFIDQLGQFELKLGQICGAPIYIFLGF